MQKKHNVKKIVRTAILTMGMLTTALFVTLFGIQNAHALITASMDVGSTGSNVTELQTYLATNASIYPSGLVTGYFGPLTQAAVQRFQTAQGIVSSGTPGTTGYGRVGPQTMMRLNSLMGSPGIPQTSWDTAPTGSTPLIQLGRTNVTVTWSTNEAAQGQIYYDTKPLRADEVTGPRQLPFVSGVSVVDGGGTINHSLTIQNLQPNTVYYYLTRSIDSVGNMSMTWPGTFRTSQ